MAAHAQVEQQRVGALAVGSSRRRLGRARAAAARRAAAAPARGAARVGPAPAQDEVRRGGREDERPDVLPGSDRPVARFRSSTRRGGIDAAAPPRPDWPD